MAPSGAERELGTGPSRRRPVPPTSKIAEPPFSATVFVVVEYRSARIRCDGKRSTTPILRQPSRSARPSSPPARTHAVDVHYTPSTVAKALVRVMRDLQPALIADLAAGNGDLLIEAERMWPTASFVATDIDRRAIRRLARRRPSWSVGRCDLRSPRSRTSCRALKNNRRSAGLMLLNPPFSCRGGTSFRVQTADGPLRASTAMSFLLLSTPYVADDGHIAAVLPLGCMYNDKDVQAWKHLASRYRVRILENYPIGTFPNSSASTVLVHLSLPVPVARPPAQSLVRLQRIQCADFASAS